MFIVAVQFTIMPEEVDAFERAALINAAASVANEPGCQQFDVSFNENGTQCFLYEVYSDESAFGDHRSTNHFAVFSKAIEGKVIGRRFETYQLASPRTAK